LIFEKTVFPLLHFSKTSSKIFIYTLKRKVFFMRGNLFIISSPSGGGKGTLIREVLRTVPNIGYSVSFTTRARREGEIHGQHYFFVSQAEFEKLIELDEFLEYANVHGNFYGTSRTHVEQEISAGRDVILEIDVQGATSIRQIAPEAIGVFILPPSYEVLRDRLILRRTESEENLALRLRNAHTEVKRYKEFDYVVINDEVLKASTDLQAVILAERLKRERQDYNVQNILKTFENLKD
jgi:guanylate kinase